MGDCFRSLLAATSEGALPAVPSFDLTCRPSSDLVSLVLLRLVGDGDGVEIHAQRSIADAC